MLSFLRLHANVLAAQQLLLLRLSINCSFLRSVRKVTSATFPELIR